MLRASWPLPRRFATAKARSVYRQRGAPIAVGAPFFYGGKMLDETLIETLPPLWRLALAYAPKATKGQWLTLMALDMRLAGVVRSAREPILAQMRLAWWRDRLNDKAANWPKGEPLLAAMHCWNDQHGALIGLVDGWEALLGEAPLAAESLLALADGRAVACAALSPHAEVSRMARGWALADLAAHVSDAQEQLLLADQLAAHDWRASRLPRAMRPLVVLHGIASRHRGDASKLQGVSVFTLIRLGLLGV